MTIARAVCLLPLCAALLTDSLGELAPGANSPASLNASSRTVADMSMLEVRSPVVMIGDMECVEGSSRAGTPYNGEWATLRNHWGIKQDWLHGTHALESTDIGSGGKSNMEFLKSHDGKFIIKGMSQVDRRSLLDILPEYTQYMMANPDSLLPRFLTACKVKKGKASKRYLVMWSWDRGRQSTASPDWKFDLKGSQEGRDVAVPEGPPAKWAPGAKIPILKDLNFDRTRGLPDRIYLDKDTRTRVLKVLERDTQWLMEHRLMDYSLFLRVENMPVEDIPVASVRELNGKVCSLGASIEPVGCKKLVGTDFEKHGGYMPWNIDKKIARFVKANGLLPGGKVHRDVRSTVEPSYYKERFMTTMDHIFIHQGEDGEEVQDG